MEAESAYYNGDYERSGECWREVQKRNSNLEISYIGLGKVLLHDGQYKEALEQFKVGGSAYYYSKTFKYYREETVNRYIYPALGIAAVLLILMLVYIFAIKPRIKKRKKQTAGGGEVWRGFTYVFYIIRHPFKGFWDMTHEGKGNLKAVYIIYVLAAVTMIARTLYMPFIFTGRMNLDFNIITTALSVFVPAALFCLCNWCITTLFSGDGKPGEIVMYTGYSLFPFVLINLPLVLVSNFLTMEEGVFIQVLFMASVLWCAILLFSGSLTVHQYSPKQTVLTLAVTVVFMVLVLFLVLLLYNLLDQLYSFLVSIVNEISTRM